MLSINSYFDANNVLDLRISRATGTNLNPKRSAKKTNGRTKKPEELLVQRNMRKRKRRGEQVVLRQIEMLSG